MADWPVYTERFICHFNPPGWKTYTVPAGKRAIVTSVVACSSAGVAVLVVARVAGARLGHFNIQVGGAMVVFACRIACYHNDLIEGYISEIGGNVIIGGYLFDDPTKARAPDNEFLVGDSDGPYQIQELPTNVLPPGSG